MMTTGVKNKEKLLTHPSLLNRRVARCERTWNATRCSIILFLFVFMLFAAGTAHAQSLEAKDVWLQSVTCMHDGVEFDRSVPTPLWNPSQAVQENAELGSEAMFVWSGGETSEFRCRYTFKQPQPWYGFEIVLGQSAMLDELSVKTLNDTLLIAAGLRLASERKLRVQPPGIYNVVSIEFAINVSCPGGTCTAKFEEVNPLPPRLDVSAVSNAEDGSITQLFFPNEPLSVSGDAKRNAQVCSGFSNTCLWVSSEHCERRRHGAYFKCDHECPGVGWYLGDAQFLSRSEFKSGRCESRGWYRPVMQVVAVVASIALAYVSLASAAPLAYMAVCATFATLAAYNPAYSLNDQKVGLIITFVVSFIMSYSSYAQATPTGGLTQAEVFSQQMGEAIAKEIITAFQTSVITGMVTLMWHVGQILLQQYAVKLTVGRLVSKMTADMKSVWGRALVSAGTSFVGGAIIQPVINSVSGILSAGYAKLFQDLLDVKLTGTLQRLAESDMETVLELNMEQAVRTGMVNGLRSAIGELTAPLLSRACEEIAEQTGDSAVRQTLTKGYCNAAASKMMSTGVNLMLVKSAEWLGSPEKPRILDVVNRLTSEQMKKIEEFGVSEEQWQSATGTIMAAGREHGSFTFTLSSAELTAEVSERDVSFSIDGEYIGTLVQSDVTAASIRTLTEHQILQVSMEKIATELDFLKAVADVKPEDFRATVLTAKAVNEAWKTADSLGRLYRQTAEQAQLYRDAGLYQKKAAKDQEQLVMNQKCACYGQLLSHPQYAKTPVPCTNEGIGYSWTHASRPLYFAGAGEIVGTGENTVTGIMSPGKGWCWQPVTAGREPGKEGSVSVSGADSDGNFSESGMFSLKVDAPSEPGSHTLNVLASTGATTPLLERMTQATSLFRSVRSSPLLLPYISDVAGALAASLVAQQFSELKSKVESIALLINQTAVLQTTMPADIAAQFSNLRESLVSLSGISRLTNERAAAEGDSTTLDELANYSDITVARLDNLSTSTNILNAIEAEKALGQAMTSIFGRNTTVTAAWIAASPQNLHTLIVRDYLIEWELARMVSYSYGWLYLFHTAYLNIYDWAEENATLDDIEQEINISYVVPFRHFGAFWNGVFTADLRGIGNALESASSTLSELSDAVAALPETDKLNTALERVDEQIASLKERTLTLRPPLEGLYGITDANDPYRINPSVLGTSWITCKKCRWSVGKIVCEPFENDACRYELGGRGYDVMCNELYPTICDIVNNSIVCPDFTFVSMSRATSDFLEGSAEHNYGEVEPGYFVGNCSINTVQHEVLVTQREPLARALTGLWALETIQDALQQARDQATDARWSMEMREHLQETAAKGMVARERFSDVASVAVEQNWPALESAINATNIEQIAHALSGAQIEGRTKVPIEVVRPEFELGGQEVKCGDGEPLTYNISIRTDVAWPVINVTAKMWTPFSMPFIPRTNITLAALARRCNVTELGWWDSASQSAQRRSGTEAENETLVPGRGYYMKSSNDCAIAFKSSFFNSTCSGVCKINMTERVTAGGLTLIGSGSKRLPFDSNSLGYKADPYQFPEQVNSFGRNACPGLRWEIWDNWIRDLGNGTELWRAIPSVNDPFDDINTTLNSSVRAEFVEPGKVYWIRGSANCSLTSSMSGELQTNRAYGPAPVGFNMTFTAPVGWTANATSDNIFNGIDDTCWMAEDKVMCAEIGSNGVERNIKLKPASTGDFGEHTAKIRVSNDAYGSNSSVNVQYALVKFVPAISGSSAINSKYSLSVTNDAPSFCQAREHKLSVETPPGWTLNVTEDRFELAPGERGDADATIVPLPAAQGGLFAAFVSAYQTDREREADLGWTETVCLPPMTAHDVTNNDTHLLYSSDDGIHAFDTRNCSDNLIIPGEARGIDYADGRIVWVDDISHKIKSYELSSHSTTNVADISNDDSRLTVDGQAVYWIENRAIKRASFIGGNISIIASDLDSPTGLDSDYYQFVYWAERDKIKRVLKTGSCSGSNCTLFASIQALLGTETGGIRDIAFSNGYIFLAIGNVLATSDRDYSKILRINLDSTIEVVAKPDTLNLLFSDGLSGITADSDYVYWSGSGVDRINRWATATVFSKYITVPGHNPSIVGVQPAVKSSVAGAPMRFNVTVINNNSAEALEGINKFWIKGIQLPPELELCYNEFQCESANEFGASFGRQALLDNYASSYKWINRNANATFALWLRPKGDLAEGTVLSFNVTVGSMDPLMNGIGSGAVEITKPRAPQVEIIPQEPWLCFSGYEQLAPGFAGPNCTAYYYVQITNPEALAANYRISVTAPEPWNVGLAQETVDVPGLLEIAAGWNQRSIVTNVSPAYPSTFGVKTFVVNVSNSEIPERFTVTTFNLTVTPDNRNGICEPELGENAENSEDCRSALVCGFGGKCDNTTASGVDWAASIINETIIGFGVCEFEPGITKASQVDACMEDFSKPLSQRTKLICSASTGLCHRDCTERGGKYFLIAKTTNANYTSPIFEYNCPTCIGKVFSAIVRDDLNVQRWRPELASGLLSFSDWLTIVAEGEFLYSMAWQQSASCLSAVKSIVDSGRALNRAASDVIASVTAVNGQCSAMRGRISDFVNTSERMITELCRYAGTIRLNITSMYIPNVTMGVPANTTLDILNPDRDAHAQARCTFERPTGFGYSRRVATSDCRPLAENEQSTFNVPIENLAAANWNVKCDAMWSMFNDCAVVISVDTRNGSLKVNPPNTSLEISSWDVPHYGVQGEEILIRLDVNNSGETANASVGCVLIDADGNEHDAESEIKTVGFSQVVPFRVTLRPDAPGDWIVESCSVYKIGSKILHQVLQIGTTLLVWPACTSACQQAGRDFGGCFANAADAISGPGEQGCDATEQCVCGTFDVTETTCARTSSYGGYSIYNATVRGQWQTGSYLRLGGTYFQNSTFEWRQQRQFGVQFVNATIFKGTTPIFVRVLELNCIAPPLVNITEPLDGATVKGSTIVRAIVVDANATLSIDGTAYNLSSAGYVWDTTATADGWHTLRVSACNDAGCKSASRIVSVQNEVVSPRYDFTIDPGSIQTDVRAGGTATLTFVIKNIGTDRDSYMLSDELNTTWPRVVSMDGVRFARVATLDAGQQAIFTVNVSVPSGAQLGQSAGLTVTATSGSGIKHTSGPQTIRVANVENSAPDLLAEWHDPMTARRGENIIFYAQLSDRNGDTISDVRVCKNSACNETWCVYTGAAQSSGTFSCSMKAPAAGSYNYFVFAKDSHGASVISSEKFFYVSALSTGTEGPDITRNASTNASSSVGSQTSDRAVDGDASTYWVSDSPLPQWLQVDLKQPKSIGGVGIYSASGARPKAFDVQIGDCTDFETAYSESRAKYSNNWYKVAFDAVLGRCVRLNVRSSEDGSPYTSIASFEVYEGVAAQRAPTCGNGICESGETNVNCPVDCKAPTPGLPIWVWIIVIGVIVGAVMLIIPRIGLWLEFYRG